MNSWIPMIPSLLDEIIYYDSSGSHSTEDPCYSCGQFSPLFCCNGCFTNYLDFKADILKAHVHAHLHHIQVSPLHRLQVWFEAIN